MRSARLSVVVSATVLFGWVFSGSASANVFNMPSGQTSLGLVPVGNAGNANDPGTGNLHGGVGYNYNISKFETTIGQYTQFLNAIAATDTYGLYNPEMATDLRGAGIARSGSSGSYTYSAIGSPNRPVTHLGWGDAARFANWLTNGQPTGAQGLATTEDGSYYLNGATADAALVAVTRTTNAHFVIPTANEWYKAAYYDPTKGGSNYWLYPMRTDSPPYSALPPGSGAPNAAYTGNFYRNDGIANTYDNGYAVTDSAVYPSGNALTDAGAYASASSFYGTFDQGGNVWEWNDAVVTASRRELRGGSWTDIESDLRASNRNNFNLTSEGFNYGFRISEVPEPASAVLMGLSGLLLTVRRKRR